MTQKDFIDKFYAIAKRVVQGTSIFPETVLTAAGIESGWGESKLSRQYNNYFGFTADNTPDVPRVFMCNQSGRDCHYYKVYETPEDSFRDYVRLLTSYSRYKPVLQADTVEGQFQALQLAGYATNPNYANILERAYNEIKDLLTNGSGTAGIMVIAILLVIAFFWGRH